jgi:hypothetical protein
VGSKNYRVEREDDRNRARHHADANLSRGTLYGSPVDVVHRPGGCIGLLVVGRDRLG